MLCLYRVDESNRLDPGIDNAHVDGRRVVVGSAIARKGRLWGWDHRGRLKRHASHDCVARRALHGWPDAHSPWDG